MSTIGGTVIKNVQQPFAHAKSVIAIYNNAVDKNILTQEKWDKILKTSDDTLAKHLTSVKGTTTTTSDYNASLVNASKSTVLLTVKTAALNAVIGMGIGLAISLLVTGITKLVGLIDDAIHAVDRQKEKVKELEQELETANSELETINSELSETATKIDALNAKGKLTFAEQGELENLQNITKELLIQQDIAEKNANQANKELAQGSADLFEKQYGGRDISSTQVDEYVSNAKITGNNAILTSDENDISSLLAAYKQFVELKEQATTTEDIEHFSGILDGLETQLWDNVSGLQGIKSNLEAVPLEDRDASWNQMISTASDGIQLIYQMLDPSKWTDMSFGQVFNSETFADVKTELESLASQGTLTAETLNNPKYKEFMNTLNGVGISAEQAANQINANIQTLNQTPDLFIPDFEELNKQIDDLQSAYSTLTASVKEYNTNGGQLSIDTLQSLLSLEPQYLACLQNENGQLVINQQSIYNLADALRANAIQKLQAAAAADLLALAEGRTEQLSWAAQVAIANMGSSIADSGNKATLAEQQLYGFANGVATAITAAGGKLDLGNLTDQQDAILNLYKDSASTVFNIGSNMNLVTDATQRAAGAANDLKQQLSQAQSAINSLLTMTMNMIKQQYADEKDRLQGLIDDKRDEYEADKDHLDEINKEKEAQYKRDREAIENQQNALKAELDSRLEMLRLKKEEYYWDKDTKENNKTISELESEYAIAKNDDSLEGIARQKDLEEQLAKAKEEWKDKQFDHDLEQQEDALQKEFDLADEKYQNELDDLERVEEERKADHQAELDRIEREYKFKRENLEREIQDISDYVAIEGNIRMEAIHMIEDKSQELYNQLMKWNNLYGDGLTSTLEIAWANGYAALNT